MTHRRFVGLLTGTLCFAAPAGALAGGPDTAHYGRGTAGIFWFMHLSDSHIGASLVEGQQGEDRFVNLGHFATHQRQHRRALHLLRHRQAYHLADCRQYVDMADHAVDRFATTQDAGPALRRFGGGGARA